MECLKNNVVFQFNADALVAVRKLFGFENAQEMSRAVDILEEWVKQQDHFIKKDFCRSYLEIAIINAKGSIERAKTQLDKMCTLRTLMPQFFGDFDFRNDMTDVYARILFVVTPMQTKDHERIILISHIEKQFHSDKFLLNAARFGFAALEYLKRYDYSSGYILVVDYTDVDILNYISKLNLVDMRQGAVVFFEGYKLRIKEIHLISNSKSINLFIDILKRFLSSKLSQRLITHENIESVHKFLSKDTFPNTYSNKNKRFLMEISDRTIDFMNTKENKEYRLDMNKAGTDESRRQTTEFNEQYMGMPGTFRNLTVD